MKLRTFVCGVGLLATSVVSAQTVDVPSLSGAPGATITTTITYDNGGSDVSSWQADIGYDRPNTGVVAFAECPATTSPAGGSINCTVEAAGQPNVFRVGTFTVPASVVGSGNVAVISFTIPAGTAPGTYPMIVDDFSAFDTGGGDVTGAFTVTAGNITVTAPAGSSFYASTPAPGATLDLGTALVGQAATAADNITVENISPDTPFNITNALASDVEVAITAPAMFPAAVAAGGSVAVDAVCTPDARGANTGTIGVEHDADLGPASAVNYNYTCAGTTPNVNVAPASIALNGLISDPADPTGTITVTNPQDGFTAAADVSAADGDAGAGPITVAPAGPVTVNPDGTTDFTVSCDRTTAGMFSDTITISWTDANGNNGGSSAVAVDCEILDAVPSYLGTPASGSTITFPATTNGTTSTPIGIDVANDGVGPSPTSDLDIISATVADAVQFGVTVNDSGPFIVGQPATADAIEVTCSPSGGATGTISTTLTIVHNGDDTDATYTLECPTASDATFASAPADGGTLNLGVVPPGLMTPPADITFSNTGAADSFDIACTVTDPDGVFTFTPDPISFTIGPGASEPAAFQCTPAAPQIYQADVACTITGADVATANYSVTCAGQPLVVPTMNRWGLILMALMLLALGGFAGRRMMA